jgi:hypothetical protein
MQDTQITAKPRADSQLLGARTCGCSGRAGWSGGAGNGARVKRFGHCGITRSFLGPSLRGRALLAGSNVAPHREVSTVKDTELKQVLRSLTKALDDPRNGPDRKMKLRRAKRMFGDMAAVGKFDRAKLYRAADLITTAFLDDDEPPHD